VSRTTVTRLFISGGLAIIAGGMLAIAAIWFAIASNVFVMNGADVVAVRGSALAWSLLGVALVGGLAIMAGAIAGLASWIGALLNTVRLDNKTWFTALLLLGIFSFGFFGMIAYLIAGPDGRRPADVGNAHVATRPTPA
jgi:hypothetical protein